MPALATRILDLLCRPGLWLSWLTLVLVLSILVSVAVAATGTPVLLDWEGTLPVLGGALTANSLTDLQWYIFALLVLFGGVVALRDNAHVAVDTVAGHFSGRTRLVIRTVGDLVFLLPFAAIIVWYGWTFAETAWTTGEGSTQGGLNDRWLMKAMLPVSFALLGLAGLVRAVGTIVGLTRGTLPGKLD